MLNQESYIEYLESIVVSLLEARGSKVDITITDPAAPASMSGHVVSLVNLQTEMEEQRTSRESQPGASTAHDREIFHSQLNAKEAFVLFQKVLAGTQVSPELRSAPAVALLAGPPAAVEAIVQIAVQKSGIPMDWGYFGGRVVVHASGPRDKARHALFMALPQSDLSQADMYPGS